MKRIRLTEGQLHRLIEQALNELDWRTYASAANKRAMGQGNRSMSNDERAKRINALHRAAEKAFKKQYGAELNIIPGKYPYYTYKGVDNNLDYDYHTGTPYGGEDINPAKDWMGTNPFALYTYDDENGNMIKRPESKIALDKDNMRHISNFANGWDVYDKNKGGWRTRPTKYVHYDNGIFGKTVFADESLSRRVTESIIRRLRRLS